MKHEKFKCPDCSGEMWGGPDAHGYINKCKTCDGKGELDWIDNIYGKAHTKRKGSLIKPGVYIKEVDLSARIPSPIIGDVYYDVSNNTMQMFDGVEYKEVQGQGEFDDY